MVVAENKSAYLARNAARDAHSKTSLYKPEEKKCQQPLNVSMRKPAQGLVSEQG